MLRKNSALKYPALKVRHSIGNEAISSVALPLFLYVVTPVTFFDFFECFRPRMKYLEFEKSQKITEHEI